MTRTDHSLTHTIEQRGSSVFPQQSVMTAMSAANAAINAVAVAQVAIDA
jgi:hypothetical protein